MRYTHLEVVKTSSESSHHPSFLARLLFIISECLNGRSGVGFYALISSCSVRFCQPEILRLPASFVCASAACCTESLDSLVEFNLLLVSRHSFQTRFPCLPAIILPAHVHLGLLCTIVCLLFNYHISSFFSSCGCRLTTRSLFQFLRNGTSIVARGASRSDERATGRHGRELAAAHFGRRHAPLAVDRGADQDESARDVVQLLRRLLHAAADQEEGPRGATSAAD